MTKLLKATGNQTLKMLHADLLKDGREPYLIKKIAAEIHNRHLCTDDENLRIAALQKRINAAAGKLKILNR